MFTGIVEEVGRITHAEMHRGDLRIHVQASIVTQDTSIGDSIAISGCCLTVVELTGSGFEAELSQETVNATAPRWEAGLNVNLERAMLASSRFGGHMVSGHVEATGEVLNVRSEPGAHVLTVRAPLRLARYLIPKGSITVDGVSLTVVDVGGPGGSSTELEKGDFTLWLIPHTLEVTTLGELQAGSIVNLEADLIAKYLDRLRRFDEAEPADEPAGRRDAEAEGVLYDD
jgi:riboflavin synthase